MIALKDGYRIDSLVLAFEQALDRKPKTDLSDPERFVLAVEAMEREVNNGGWDQFFLNRGHRFDSVLVTALKASGCPNAATISQDAPQAYGQGRELDDYDILYFANSEPIADKLFVYIVSRQREIQLLQK